MEVEVNRYRYIEKNLLDEPEYYKYSKYEGTKYFENYFYSRNKCVSRFEKEYISMMQREDWSCDDLFSDVRNLSLVTRREIFSGEIRAAHEIHSEVDEAGRVSDLIKKYAGDSEPLSAEIETSGILLKSLFLQLSGELDSGNEDVKWLNYLTGRFEVTRKIYAVYNKEMKPAADNYEPLINYILLAINLLLLYEKNLNLKMLNCALKLNDLICSINHETLSIEETYLAIFSLRLEIKFVKRLTSRNGLII